MLAMGQKPNHQLICSADLRKVMVMVMVSGGSHHVMITDKLTQTTGAMEAR
jgi:hypothetical protein